MTEAWEAAEGEQEGASNGDGDISAIYKALVAAIGTRENPIVMVDGTTENLIELD